MTNEEIEIFRSEFANIIYWRGNVKTQSAYQRTLESWNKNESHRRAILDNIQKIVDYKAKLKYYLKGKSYEDWCLFSKNISKIKSRINSSVNDSTKTKWRKELENLKSIT